MALNILKAGHTVTVYNRSHDKEIPLSEAGAQRAQTPAEAARDAEVVVICVSDTPDVSGVLFDKEGVLAGAGQDTIVIDTSTISPVATRDYAARLAEAGIHMLDAPVSGGSEGAIHGTLTIMVGGDAAIVAKAMPILQAMGKTITHVGPIGAGQTTKAINQIIISGTFLGVAEGMVLGMKAGLDMDKVIAALRGGAAGSWVMDNRSHNMVRNDYPLGFRVRLHNKDLRIALETAKDLGVVLPVTALTDQIESGLMSKGFGDDDISALARNLRQQAGLDD